MTDRDRLIELIDKVLVKYDRGCLPFVMNEIADYLLANGVIVPPCKVGDAVYIIGKFTGQFMVNKVVAINYGGSGLFLLLDSYAVVAVAEQLGKTVFLTKEEAEEKLKELSNEKI